MSKRITKITTTEEDIFCTSKGCAVNLLSFLPSYYMGFLFPGFAKC